MRTDVGKYYIWQCQWTAWLQKATTRQRCSNLFLIKQLPARMLHPMTVSSPCPSWWRKGSANHTAHKSPHWEVISLKILLFCQDAIRKSCKSIKLGLADMYLRRIHGIWWYMETTVLYLQTAYTSISFQINILATWLSLDSLNCSVNLTFFLPRD